MRAGVAQLAEHKLPKLGVAGSSPVARSMSQEQALFVQVEGICVHRGVFV